MRLASSFFAVFVILAIPATGDTAQQQQPAPPTIDPSTAPPPVAAAIARADRAIQELQATLVGRLNAALADGGPRAAVAVCRDEASALTEKVAATHRLEIGRTSHRLRNPDNAPRAWAGPIVAAHAGRKFTEAQPRVLDLGRRLGVLRPIGTLDFCVTCHGPRETVDAAIGDLLRTAYPQDAAVGFAPGDLRGWIWVEVPLD